MEDNTTQEILEIIKSDEILMTQQNIYKERLEMRVVT